ncbi:transcriptional regulator ATRX homolog isoform X2 [Anthonomus grandis grandis]|uniref:transcriptional regulator ATRX homolog isoform X2 n=1 Tax=Anthonomus grandis grandis TaxID=2921223 RepID=UPI0021666644|nr:transcriptional regulator ATRX homolog isoform X2 [Anthonomus grandis grandis]
MTEEIDIDQMLVKFQDALDVLAKLDDVDELLNKLDSQNNRTGLRKVKGLISNIHTKINNVKEKVYTTYKRVKVRQHSNIVEGSSSELEEVNETINLKNIPSPINNDHDATSEIAVENQLTQSNTQSVETSNQNSLLDSDKESSNGDKTNENIVINETRESELNSNSPRTPPRDSSLPFNSDDFVESTPVVKVVNSKTVGNSAIEISDSLIVESSDKEDNSEAEKEIAPNNVNISENDSKEMETNQDEEKEAALKKPSAEHPLKIKLVDINKLLAPTSKPMDMTPPPTKGRKSVTFDSSVIVLDSSDEETPKKTPKESAASPLKSALRKGSNKDGSLVELSDSDSKENDENHGNKREESRKEKKKVLKSESDDSDSNSRSRRRKRMDKQRRSQFSELVKERSKRRASKEVSDGEQSSDVDKAEKRQNKRKKRISYCDSESDSEVETKGNKMKKKKKESNKSNYNLDKSLSKISKKKNSSDSDSDSGDQVLSRISEKREPNLDDPKLKSLVHIRLPKFKCEELQDLYETNREFFEVKKLSKSSHSRHSRPKIKSIEVVRKPGIKLTLKLNKKDQKKGSSDDESSSTGDSDDLKKKSLKKVTPDVDSDVAMEEEKSKKDADTCSGDEKDNHEKEALKENNTSPETSPKMKKKKVQEEEDPVNNISDSDGEKGDSRKENSEQSDSATVVTSGNEVGDRTHSDKSESDQDSDSMPLKAKKNNPSTACSDNNSEDKDKKSSKSASESDSDSKNNKSEQTGKVTNISDSDSDVDFAKFSRKKTKSKKEIVKEAKKRMQKKSVISDSDSDDESSNKNKKDESDNEFLAGEAKESSSSSEAEVQKRKDSTDDESDEESKSKPSRRRIKRVKDSSSDDDEKSTRKHLRKMIDRDSLAETTKKAEADERERKFRIAEKQAKYNKIFELKADVTVDKVVLDFDEKTEKPLLSVHKKLVKQLKPHQVQGVKFMWDACFESLSRARKSAGGGCILAHCMGLGKTLQVITLVHTLLMNKEKTKVEKVLVVSPVNTVLNWKSEFKKWMPNEEDFEVFELVSCKTSAVNQERNYTVKCWHEEGGVLIIGYNMFRNISNPDSKTIPRKMRSSFQTALVDPGADLVICDEGHLLKNEKTNLSIAMNRIKTQRRIVLTGTPLQNNLREYWCMVQFIKPNLLGTYKEYLNRFVNPITNGQYTDSTQHDIMIMRRRSHVLHKLLDGVVQRQDYEVLEPYLPPKYEYVLFLKLTPIQAKLYKHYLDNFARRGKTARTSFLFIDFQELQRICTHPRVLLMKSIEDMEKKDNLSDTESEGSLKDFINDGSEAETTPEGTSSSSGSESDGSKASIQSGNAKVKQKGKAASSGRRVRLTRAQAAMKRKNGDISSEDEVEEVKKHWFDEYLNRDELDDINMSSKIYLLFQILKECEEIGDKILVFSQSLYTLNCIEYFLSRIDDCIQSGESEKVGGFTGSWCLGLDYFRLDGSSSCDNRANWCDQFNDPENIRARLFLISTKAGGLGINLVAANRVIIFDVSWNPSHDIQSIYRVYRFGQNKPSYIYRFVTYGTMEMKIYERQVTKQAISKRVIDEQQIDRHYSQNDIQELYMTDLEPTDRPIPLVPKDVLLGELLQKHEEQIYKYHEHQTLLENKQDEELNEEERKAAWDEFENEKVIRKTTVTNFGSVHLGAITNSALNFSPQLIQMALANIVKKDNPTWSDVQIKGILPALVTQLQVQMFENDYSMYARVEQEIRLMQAIQAQRMRENYIKQYQLQMQKQQMYNQQLGNLNITPEQLRALQLAQASQNVATGLQGPSRANDVGLPSEVIELND